jgi:hypothetical protein
MIYCRIDVDLPEHPKVVEACAENPLAGWLYVKLICYCRKYLTDGFVSNAVMRKICLDDISIESLLRFRLVRRANRYGYVLPDYSEYNTTREQVKGLTEAGKKGAEARWKRCDSHANRMRSKSNSKSSTKNTCAIEGFETWWTEYPRKVDKRRAESAYCKALERTDAETLLSALSRYPFSPDPKFIPHPSTWLNNDRWLSADEDIPDDPY